MQTTNSPGPRRFTSVSQFRMDGKTGGGIADMEEFVRVVVFESIQDGMNLRKFLKEKILFGNFGELSYDEMKALATAIFIGPKSVEYLAQLRSDHCMGYTNLQEDVIIALLETPTSDALTVALALGFIPPKPRRF